MTHGSAELISDGHLFLKAKRASCRIERLVGLLIQYVDRLETGMFVHPSPLEIIHYTENSIEILYRIVLKLDIRNIRNQLEI